MCPCSAREKAARGFRKARKAQGAFGQNHARSPVEPARLSLDQFDLELVQVFATTGSLDGAAVHRKLGPGAVIKMKIDLRATDVGFRDRLQRCVFHQLPYSVPDLIVFDRIDRDCASSGRLLDLSDPGKTACDGTVELDGLQPAPAVTPQAQGDAVFAQDTIRCVEVDAAQKPAFVHPARIRGQSFDAREQVGHLLLFQQQFQLDFGQEGTPHTSLQNEHATLRFILNRFCT